jgi:hypothetical protein
VLGAAAAGAAAGGAAAAAAGDPDAAPTRAGSTLSRADALAAERTWDQEPEQYDDEPEDEPERRKRSPWTWPLIALIVLLLLVLGGTIWALLANQGGDADPTPTSTSTSASPSATPSDTPTPTPTEERIDVTALALEGKTGNAAPTADEVGLVYDVNPTGRVEPGTTIVLTAYGDQVAMPAPGAPTLSASEVAPGGTITVNWQGYSCPAGEGSPSAYNLSATNGTFTNGQSTSAFGNADRAAEITVPNNATGTLIVTYTVTCTGGPSGDRTSGASPEATATILAPAPPDGDDDTTEP